MGDRNGVDRAVADARAWVGELGTGWIARFDQMHCDVRRWAEQVGVDPQSYEFRAAWCVATTFLHEVARRIDSEDPEESATMSHMANVLATVGLWGRVASSPAEPSS